MMQSSIVLTTMQLVAQAESELKHQKNEAPVFEPIKATPQHNWPPNGVQGSIRLHPKGRSQTRKQSYLHSLETYSINHGKNV